jgi:tetratricopeptide (TPR) repeat protein
MLLSPCLVFALSVGLVTNPHATDSNSLAVAQPGQANVQPAIPKERTYRREADTLPRSARSLEANRKLALEYLKTFRKPQAIAACREMLDTYERSNAVGRAVISVAHTAMEAGDYVTARAIYDMVNAAWPDGDISLRARKAIVLMDIAVADDATVQRSLDDFYLAHKDRRDSAVEGAFVSIGRACMDHRGPASAMPFCRRVLAAWPQSSRARIAFQPTEILLCPDPNRQDRLAGLLKERTDTSLEVAVAVANQYVRDGRHEQAYSICAGVVAAAPGSSAAAKAIATKAAIDISRGKNSSVAASLLQLDAQQGVTTAHAGAVLSIGDSYRHSYRDSEASAVYSYAGQKWPTGGSGIQAKAGRAVTIAQSEADIASQVDACLATPDPNGKMFGRLFLGGTDLLDGARKEIAAGNVAEGKALLARSMGVWKAMYAKSPTSQKGVCCFALGECYREQAMYTEAIAQYEKSLQDSPMGPEASSAQFMIGECYRVLSEQKAIDPCDGLNKMLSAYKKVLRNYPGGPMASSAAARLRVLSDVAKGGAQ